MCRPCPSRTHLLDGKSGGQVTDKDVEQARGRPIVKKTVLENSDNSTSSLPVTS